MSLKNRQPTVTLGICVYNEAKNMANLLSSALRLKSKGFKLQEILVYSDGSTDKTIEVVKSFKVNKIKVFNHKKRMGKANRLIQMFRYLNTDYLVIVDGDVIFKDDQSLENLVKVLAVNKSVGLSCGYAQPKNGVTFIENAVNYTHRAYTELKSQIKRGNSIYTVEGRIIAYKKDLVKKLYIPKDMIGIDVYTYFEAIRLGYKYKYVKEAVVLFRSPQTLRDHIKQNVRFLSRKVRMRKYFSKDLVKKEFAMPKFLFFKVLVKTFLKNPISCAFIFVINIYCRYKALQVGDSLNAKWKIAISTKDI